MKLRLGGIGDALADRNFRIFSIGSITLLQTSVPDEQRGRVMGTEFPFSRIAGGIGTYLVGAAAERHGLELPMLLAVGVCLVAWGYAYARRRAIQDSSLDAKPAMIENEMAT